MGPSGEAPRPEAGAGAPAVGPCPAPASGAGPSGMLLAVDIGNTDVKLGVFRDAELVDIWRLTTDHDRTADEYAVMLQILLSRYALDFSALAGLVMCSSVPSVQNTFAEIARRYLGCEALVVRGTGRTGIRVNIDNPHEVGGDRVSNAVAARALYGAPAIVIDFGTATNFDVLSPEGDYIGGALAPGIEVAADALFRRGARLFNVALTAPKRAIGRNTVTALQSGIVFGYVGLIEGLIARIQRELGGGAHVIATGGLASLVAHETAVIEHVDPHLTLTGLRLIYELNRTED
jgi:type III pantothenate kinase